MKIRTRAPLALLLAASALGAATTVAAQDAPPAAQAATSLSGERERASYMVGMDVGGSIAPVGPDLDFEAFERAIRNAFAGGEPLLADAEVQPVAQALMQRIAARSGQGAAGATPPTVDREKVGLLVGTDVGRSLKPISDELDLAVVLQAVRTRIDGGTPLLDEAEAAAVRQAFSARIQDRMQAKQAELARTNLAEGEAFLAGNRGKTGVQVTGSGLQYRVLRQGAGARPAPTDRVRVHYQGALLDGTVFDSSYERGAPAEFALSQVVPGWTEGVGLMPVGGKYRFWIPAALAYGEAGTPGGPIGPNATLVFDVELLDIL
ncbi:FKBP-type peptidyl-prolyl cis-trans isomerase [Luteimonas pelagia]